MEITYVQFLQMVKASLYKESIEFSKGEEIDWQEIFNLSSNHNLLPMVYESVYNSESFKNSDELFINSVKSMAKQITLGQFFRSERFLKLYKEFLKEDIKVLVFKGIILRNLYPIPDERISSDEDMYVTQKDFLKCEEIILKNNFKKILEKDEEQDVYHYYCEETNLHLELHVSLFSKDSDNFNEMNEIFKSVFEDPYKIKINNTDIYTFSIDKHFLYVICHAIKHFLGCGMGVRQICDINMYINRYHDLINWKYIWDKIYDLEYETIFINILQICIDYLGLDEANVKYIRNKKSYYIDTQDLLQDMIDGGVYGTSTKERQNAANMSLNAVNEKSKLKITSNLRAVFPKKEYLEGRYKYLKKYPFLLPIAWLNRLNVYIKDRGGMTKAIKDGKETVLVGNRRIDLLKKYKLID